MSRTAVAASLSLPRIGRLTATMRAAPVSATRMLRVAVVAGGAIVEERGIARGRDVTIGTSEKCTFVITAAGHGQSMKLFEARAGQHVLRVIKGMSGRVALGSGTILDLASEHRVSEIVLDDRARGRLTVGDATILFQVVPAPPAVGKPQLPQGVQSSFFASLDWPLTIIASLSFLAHFGVIGTLYADWADRVVEGDAIAAGLVESMRPAIPIVVETARVEVPKATDPTTPRTDGRPTTTPRPTAPAPRPDSPSQNDFNRMIQKLDHDNAAAIAVLDPRSQRSSRAVLEEGNVPLGDLDAMAKRDSAMSSRDDHGLRLGEARAFRPGARSMSELGEARAVEERGTSQDVTGPRNDRRDNAPPPPVISKGLPGAEGVLAGARARARACFQAGLGTNPDMEGSVGYTLGVTGGGSVGNVRISSGGTVSATVVSCVEGVLHGLHFDAPDGGAATVSGSFKFVNASKKR